jgi:hypothetical protein
MTYASTNKCATTCCKKYTPNDQPWSWGRPPDRPEPEATMATGSQQHVRTPGHQAQRAHTSGANPTHNPVNSPRVLGCLAHDGPGATTTPRSHLHNQSRESHLMSGNARNRAGHHAACDDAYMRVKTKNYPLCDLPKSCEGISGLNSEAQEPTMAPSSRSNAFRYDTTSACPSFCDLPQSQNDPCYIGNDD